MKNLEIKGEINLAEMEIFQDDEDFFIVSKKNYKFPRERYEEIKKENCATMLAELENNTPFIITSRFRGIRKETQHWVFHFGYNLNEIYAFRKEDF